MVMQAYIDEIKLKLGGDILDLELSDEAIAKLVSAAVRECQRYIDTTKLVTVPFSKCIDLSEYEVSSVSRVFRTTGFTSPGVDESGVSATTDPMYLSMWQTVAGGNNVYDTSNWAYNYGSWNTMLQVRNTLSTDLQFRFDKHTNLLYINTLDTPEKITVEYIPVYRDVSEICSDYWIDMIMNLSIALAKVTIGRVRKKFSQSNALWSVDTSILDEGTTELADLRDRLKAENQLVYGID